MKFKITILLVFVFFSSTVLACEKYGGNYKTVSESHWNYDLYLSSDCSFKSVYSIYRYDDKNERINLIEETTGVWSHSDSELKLSFKNGDTHSYTHFDSISFSEFGGNGEAPGLLWNTKKGRKISFWKFPKDN